MSAKHLGIYRLELLPLNNEHPYTTYERNDDNAGFDLFCPVDMDVQHTPQLLPLGVKARLVRISPDGEYDSHYWLLPRSSIYKSGFMMGNSVGVIDKTYRGELKAPVLCTVSTAMSVQAKKGERYFQIVAPDMGWIREVRIVTELPDTARNEGGFGSTGK